MGTIPMRRSHATAAVAIACALTCTGCRSSTPSAQVSPAPHSASPSFAVHRSNGEHLRLSGTLAADIQVAVVADCPATGPGLQLVFDAAGRRWDLRLLSPAAVSIDAPARAGRFDLSDLTQMALFLDPYEPTRTGPLPAPTPGPVEHFVADSGTVTVAADRRSGTVDAALTNAQSGPIDVTATPPPPAVIEHIDGSWSC